MYYDDERNNENQFTKSGDNKQLRVSTNGM